MKDRRLTLTRALRDRPSRHGYRAPAVVPHLRVQGRWMEQAGGRVFGAPFIVGDHALRDAEFLSQFHLRIAGGFAQRHHALAKVGGRCGLVARHRHAPRLHRMPVIVSVILHGPSKAQYVVYTARISSRPVKNVYIG